MRERLKFGRLSVPLLALGVFAVSIQPAFAVQLVRFSVSIDGKPVLETSTSGHGESADRMWQHLKQLHLRPVKGFQVQLDRDDPLRATLQGKIVIQVDSGGRAEVSELRLVRENEDAPWIMAPADVARTLQNRHKPFVFAVSIDGKPQLATGLQSRTGNTRDDADNVWRQLERLSIVPIQHYKIEPAGDDPLHATITGNVVIKLTYDDQPWGRAEVSELRLVRERVRGRWRIDPADVERTFKTRERPR